MKFKKIALLTSLVIALTGQSLWAMDDVVVSDAAAQRLALVSQVATLLTEGQEALDTASKSFRWGKQVDSLNAALRQFRKARELTAGCLDLTSADGELLAVQVFSCLGDTHYKLFEIENESQKLPNATLAGQSYVKASLLGDGADAILREKMSVVEQSIRRPLVTSPSPAFSVAEIIRDFDAFYAKTVDGTSSDHVGIKTRFDRFNAKFPQEKRATISLIRQEELLRQLSQSNQSSSDLSPRVLEAVREVQAIGGRAMVVRVPRSLLTLGTNGPEFMALMQAMSGAPRVGIRSETLQAMLTQLGSAPDSDEEDEEATEE